MPPLLPLTPLGSAELSSVRSAVARLNLTHFDTDLGATKIWGLFISLIETAATPRTWRCATAIPMVRSDTEATTAH